MGIVRGLTRGLAFWLGVLPFCGAGGMTAAAEIPEDLTLKDSEAQPFAPELVRGASRSLDSASSELQLISLALLDILANTGGTREDLIEQALLESDAVARVRRLGEEAQDERVAALAEEVVGTLRARLELEGLATEEGHPALEMGSRLEVASGTEHGVWHRLSASESGKVYELELSRTDDEGAGGIGGWAGSCGIPIVVLAGDGESVVGAGVLLEDRPFRVPSSQEGEDRFLRFLAPRDCALERVEVEVDERPAPRRAVGGSSIEEAIEAEVGATYEVRLSEGEARWFRFRPVVETIHVIETSRLTEDLDTRLSLSLPDEPEEAVATNDDGGRERWASRLTMVGGGDEYLVRLENLAETGGECELSFTGKGTVSELVARGEPVPLPEASRQEDAPAIEKDVLYEGFVGLAFQQWAKVAVEAGKLYEISVAGGDVGFDSELSIHDETEEELAYNDDASGLDSRIEWVAPRDGTFYVQVGELSGNPGAFELGIHELESSGVPIAVAHAPDEAVPLEIGNAYFGAIDEDEEQWLRFSAREGGVYRIEARERGGPFDSRLWLYEDARGEDLAAFNDDWADDLMNLDSRIEWQASRDGDYVFKLDELDGYGGGFTVTVEELSALEVVPPERKPFDGWHVGDRVILSRHREIDGEENWDPEMEQYVGKAAEITELFTTEPGSGAYLVRVDIDHGEWSWRTESLTSAESQNLESAQESTGDNG